MEEIVSTRKGIQYLSVRLQDTSLREVINFPQYCGDVDCFDKVLINCLAVEMRLGTGGYDFVICKLEDPTTNIDSLGHIFKQRYTPLQFPVVSVESPESPHHETLQNFTTLSNMPIVCCELHSQVPAVIAGIRSVNPTKGVALVQTDGSSIPIAFSTLVHDMKRLNWLQFTITCGHSFGGDYEAVTLHSALGAAKLVCNADVVIVSQGPGSVGTDTPFGFSGTQQADALNAAIALVGFPIGVLRMSDGDERLRHQALSHHSITIFERLVLGAVHIGVPHLCSEIVPDWRHLISHIDTSEGIEILLNSGLDVKTMGRSVVQDMLFFEAAVAAGVLAGRS